MDLSKINLDSLSGEELSLILQQVRMVDTLPYTASPKQMEFHLAEENGADCPVLYGGAIGGGKTYALCADGIRECLEIPGNRVLLARKTSVDFKKTTLVTLKMLLPKDVIHRKVEQEFIFPNNSVLLYMGLGDEKANEKIRSLEIGYLGIDEASEIDGLTFKMACSRLRWKPAMDAKRIKVRLVSNPTQGWLKEDFIDSPRPGYRYIRATMRDNPFLDPEYEKATTAIFSTDPQWRKAMVEGDWNAFTGSAQVIPSHLIPEAAKRHANPGTPCIWGLDVARLGSDSTVLVERRGYNFEIIKKWNRIRLDLQSDDIVKIYESRLSDQRIEDQRAKLEKREAQILVPSIINIDDIGLGGGLADMLIGKNLPAKGINVGRASKRNSHKFYNFKAELWWNLRQMFESDNMDIPDLAELKTELGAVEFEYVGGRIKIQDKEIVRKNIGRSPDYADALALAAWTGVNSYVSIDDDDWEEMPIAYNEKEMQEEKDYQKEKTVNTLLKLMGKIR